MPNVSIKSIAVELPSRKYSNDHPVFNNIEELPLFWTKFWGINRRGFFDWKAGENETTAILAACKKALAGADIQGSQIDMVLCSSSFPIIFDEKHQMPSHRILPRLSLVVQREFGIPRSISNQADCLSFLANMEFAAGLIKQGLAKNILICSVEYMSAALDMVNPVSLIFGDGAAAAVLSASNGDGNLLSSHFISDAEHYKVALGRLEKNSGCGLADSGDLYWPYFNLERNGANKMKTFIPFVVPRVAKAALKKVERKIKEVDYFIFHQPSVAIVKAWAAGLGIGKNRYCMTMDNHGVLASVSIPLTLHHALTEKKISGHETVLFAGAATGWNFGAQLWKLDGTVAC